MKKYDFSIQNTKYFIEFKNLSDSLIIRIIKDDDNLNEVFEKKLFFEEIYEINKSYREFKNKDEIINLLYNDIFLAKDNEFKIDNNYLIIVNDNLKIETKFQKLKQNEDDITNDIFKILSSLENQVNEFSKNGQEITNNLQNNLNQFENIISNYKNQKKH